MARLAVKLLVATGVLTLCAVGCARHETSSALYVLEELEAASAVRNPAGRVERLTIFVGNHKDSPYRFIAYKRAFETLSTEMKDEAEAARFLAAALAKENDWQARGELLFVKFESLIERNKAVALMFADTLMRTERSSRLFLYMGYELMDPKADPDRAIRCFLKSADLSVRPYAKSQALMMAGAVLEEQGKKDEAMGYLTLAAGNAEADGLMAKILWEEGRREEALDLYVRCAARMPGAREHEKLDSLYALVYPNAKDLDDSLMSLRMVDEGPIPEGVFVDLEGRAYDLSKLKGAKIVLYALSPT